MSDVEKTEEDSSSSTEEETVTEVDEEQGGERTGSHEKLLPIGGLAAAQPLTNKPNTVVGSICTPFKWFGRRYARVRDWIIRYVFSYTLLTMPLLGPLTWHWWSIDINILELVAFGGIFAGATLGGRGSEYGIASGIMTCLVLLPVARNNVFKYVFGIPYERMIKYHRWCGYYIIVPITIHAISYADFFDDTTRITGTVAWIAVCLMPITSFYLFRRYKFEFFYFTHFLFIVFLGAAIAHEAVMIAFMIPGAIMYGIDIFLRLIRYWQRSTKTLSIVQYDESLCKLELEKKFSYKAGQYAFILVPRISRLQWHPISFSSTPQEQTITFHIRDLGSWSRGINRLNEDDPCTVKVDGPYGKVGIAYKKYKVLALFAAGAGITPMMSVLKDIYLRRQMNQRCDVEKVYFYWSAGKAGCIEWFAEDLSFMVQNPLDNLDIQMNIFVARKRKNHIQSEEAEKVPLTFGRNNLKENFKKMKEENKGKTIGVLICGPKRYDYEIRQQCFIRSWMWPWTTTFHYHHETFAF